VCIIILFYFVFNPDPNTDPDSDNDPPDQWGAWRGGQRPIVVVECYVVTISKHFNWPIYRFNYVFMRNIESVIRKNTHRAAFERLTDREGDTECKREREREREREQKILD